MPELKERNKKSNIKRCYLFPKTLGQSLQYSLNPSLKRRGFTNQDIIDHWPQIIGSELANYCHPIRITRASEKQKGILYVKCSSAWAVTVKHSESLILERLSIYYGFKVADTIRILP